MGKFTDNMLTRGRRPQWRDDGDCYEASGRFILDMDRNPKWSGYPTEECILVHGRPTLQRPPYIKYGHAWIEVPKLRLALNVATGREMICSIENYYQAGQINPEDECYRYTPEEAAAMMAKFGHFGPWEGVEAVPPKDE